MVRGCPRSRCFSGAWDAACLLRRTPCPSPATRPAARGLRARAHPPRTVRAVPLFAVPDARRIVVPIATSPRRTWHMNMGRCRVCAPVLRRVYSALRSLVARRTRGASRRREIHKVRLVHTRCKESHPFRESASVEDTTSAQSRERCASMMCTTSCAPGTSNRVVDRELGTQPSRLDRAGCRGGGVPR